MAIVRPDKSAETRLINLRWLSVIAMLAVAVASVWIVGETALLLRLASVALVLGCANAMLALYTRSRRGAEERVPMFSPFAHLVLDLVAWMNFIYFSGGATNPLISVFLPFVAIGAMLLDRAQAWLFGGLAVLAYSYLWFFHQPLAIADAYTATSLHIFGMWLVFVVSDGVLVWFILQVTKAVRERDAALARAREQAIRNDWLVAMGSLAAGAAHELSTPLGTMNVVLDDLLDDAAVPEALRPDLSLMKRQIEKCKQALAQLTNRASRVSDQPPHRTAALSWLERIVDAWVALNPGTNVNRRQPSELGALAVSDDIVLERAIASLLDNAQRAGATLIEIDAEVRDESIAVSIADNGEGFTPTALAAFRSGQPVVSDNGMGVGLLLARAAIERHGGSIDVRAVDGGRGACVTFRLPREEEEGAP